MMASHGVATITPTISEAFDLLYYTERAAQQQILAMQTGRELNILPQHVIDERSRSSRPAPGYGNKNRTSGTSRR
jgi:ribulose-5-phosphate 4-epimerase/fuculose-1-phosphate aldolase